MCEQSTCYELDEKLVIVSIGGTWQVFAEANDGAELDADKVCGRSLWEFVEGETTRKWLNTIFQKVRSSGQGILIPYRCDSPELKRHMRMLVKPAAMDGHLILQHEIMHVEARSTPMHFCFEPKEHPDQHQRCSSCGRLKGDDRWFEPTASFGGAHRFSVSVSYSICEDCRKLVGIQAADSYRVLSGAW